MFEYLKAESRKADFKLHFMFEYLKAESRKADFRAVGEDCIV